MKTDDSGVWPFAADENTAGLLTPATDDDVTCTWDDDVTGKSGTEDDDVTGTQNWASSFTSSGTVSAAAPPGTDDDGDDSGNAALDTTVTTSVD